jgi:hypothetical protein
MWGRFWDSFGAVDHTTESGSVLSDTSSHHRSSHLSVNNNGISPQPSTSLSQLKSYSDITPNESASMANQDISSIAVADDDGTFTFKFTSAGGQKIHRLVCQPVFNELLEAVRVKLVPERGDDVGDEEWLSLSYLDDEEDNVLISCDADVQDAVHLARKVGQSNVKLLVQDQKLSSSSSSAGLEVISTSDNEEDVKPVPAAAAAEKINTVKSSSSPAAKKTCKSTQPQQTGGNPLLLPAAIGFLGVVIAGVFVYSRVQQSNN